MSINTPHRSGLVLSLLVFLLFVSSCTPRRSRAADDAARTFTLAQKARNVHPERGTYGEADTLLFAIADESYRLTPAGVLAWGKQYRDSIQVSLDPEEYELSSAYYYPLNGARLFLCYEDTNMDASGTSLVVIDTKAKEIVWRLTGLPFNMRPPYITSDQAYAYISALGTVGKINLSNGEQAFLRYDLYGGVEEQTLMMGADTILFRGDSTIFVSLYEDARRTPHFKTTDSIIYNERTRELTYRISRPIDTTTIQTSADLGKSR